MNFYLFFIFLTAFSFFTANAYAATLTVNLNEGEDNPANLRAVVSGSAIPGGREEEQFTTGGQAFFDNVTTGSYAINVLNENNDVFSVVELESGQCDNIIASEDDSETCDVTFDNDIDVNDGSGIPLTSNVIVPAKFTVKTQISNECLSSPICKVIKERDIREEVYKFTSGANQHWKVSDFPGSNLSRILIFDDDDDFKYNNILQVEAYAHPRVYSIGGGDPIMVNIEYNSCNVYIKPGQEINCIITIKPYDELAPNNDSISQ